MSPEIGLDDLRPQTASGLAKPPDLPSGQPLALEGARARVVPFFDVRPERTCLLAPERASVAYDFFLIDAGRKARCGTSSAIPKLE